MLKKRFEDLRDGARIVSSKAFSPVNFRITDRNLNGKCSEPYSECFDRGKSHWEARLTLVSSMTEKKRVASKEGREKRREESERMEDACERKRKEGVEKKTSNCMCVSWELT